MCIPMYPSYLTHNDPNASPEVDGQAQIAEHRTVAEMRQPRTRPRPGDGDTVSIAQTRIGALVKKATEN